MSKIDWDAEGKEHSEAIRDSEIVRDRSLIVGPPTPVSDERPAGTI